MAKITALDIADRLTGDEHLPIVQGLDTKRATMGAFRDLITPFLQYWYKGEVGDTGPAANTYTSYAAMQASDPTRRAARLVGDTDVPPHPDGSYSNPTQKINGWVAQQSTGIGYRRRGSSSAIALTAQDILEQSCHLIEWLPYGWKADGSVDYSKQLQAAMDFRAAQGGGVVQLPLGAITADAYFTNQVVLEGQGKRESRLLPTGSGHQFQLRPGSLVRFGLRNLWLDGRQGSVGQDLVHIQPSGAGTITDSVYFEKVSMTDAPRTALHLEGPGDATGGFVQLATIDCCEITNNGLYNIKVVGAVIETDIDRSSICAIRDLTGNGASVQIEPSANGTIPSRFACYSTIFNNPLPNRLPQPADAPAVRIFNSRNITFTNCSFEECGAGVDIYKSQSVKVDFCDFANGSGWMDAAVRVRECDTLDVKFAGLSANIRRGVQILGTPKQVPNPKIDPGYYAGARLDQIVTDAYNGGVEIINDKIQALRTTIVLLGQSNQDDSLSGITRINSDTGTGFVDGQRITLTRRIDTGVITIRHGTGNLLLANAQNFVMSATNPTASITFAWSLDRNGWIEITRSGVGSMTVAQLTPSSAYTRGARAIVSDATATITAGIGTVVVGGGANVVPVFNDGAGWRIG
jgi:hypothetical protein